MKVMPGRGDAAAPARVGSRATWLVSQAHARANALLAAAFDARGGGLRGYHFRLLAALDDSGPASQADLGRQTGIDRSDVTAAVSDLEAQGLVRRSVDPDNRRRKIVSLTPAGTRRLTALDRVITDVQDEFLAPLTPAERRQLLRLIRRLGEG
jgi:MarR family transcriptional regulator, lower aerobic nicotinate degradation pathway regulator